MTIYEVNNIRHIPKEIIFKNDDLDSEIFVYISLCEKAFYTSTNHKHKSFEVFNMSEKNIFKHGGKKICYSCKREYLKSKKLE